MLAAAVVGCGPDSPSNLPTTDNGDGSSNGHADGDGNGDGANINSSRVARTFESWDFSTCKPQTDCAKLFAEQAGLSLSINPRAVMKNPDPSWLPEWEQLPKSNDKAPVVLKALVLAASNRSWAKRCDELYGDYSKKLGARIADAEKVIGQEAVDQNPYDRIAALMALRPTHDPDPPTEFSQGSDPARFIIEAAIYDAFDQTNRTFLYTVGGYGPAGPVVKVIHKREQEMDEHDAFCYAASRGEIAGIPKLPEPMGTEQVRSLVKQYISDDRAAQLEKHRKELAEVSRVKFERGRIPNPSLPPNVNAYNAGSIQSFERDGKGALLTILLLSEHPDANGRMQKIDNTLNVTFPDWPSGVTLDAGDEISFYGQETSVKETVIAGAGQTRHEHVSKLTTITGKHVFRLSSHGKTMSYF